MLASPSGGADCFNRNQTPAMNPCPPLARHHALVPFSPRPATRGRIERKSRWFRPLAVLCVMMNSAMADTYGLFTYTSSATTITITGYPKDATGAVDIPATIIGKPVTGIAPGAFSSCKLITSVSIPASVTNLSSTSSTFSNCSALTSFNVDAANPAFSSADGVLFNKSQATLLSFSGGKSGAYAVPESVTSIGTSAFSYCAGLTSVSIPASVIAITSGAFARCSGLTSINVDAANPNYSSVDGILSNRAQTTLIQCPGGKSGGIAIPDGVTSVGANVGTSAFAYCAGLTSLSIPASVTSIPSGIFTGCSALVSITVDPANPNYSSADGILFNQAQTTLIVCPGGKSGAVAIPNSVTDISSSAFTGCAGMTNVTIPASVINLPLISLGAFSGCTGLTSISVDPANPDYSSVDGILFNQAQTKLIVCPGGKSGDVAIPNGVTSVDYATFYTEESLG